mmetsp:Transcript_13888/g.44017  ORF Transcript_13888/g.44017 Transcript_13888/m.44017 type:complete len:479 (+) Transcript_13888:371-1807(+)
MAVPSRLRSTDCSSWAAASCESAMRSCASASAATAARAASPASLSARACFCHSSSSLRLSSRCLSRALSSPRDSCLAASAARTSTWLCRAISRAPDRSFSIDSTRAWVAEREASAARSLSLEDASSASLAASLPSVLVSCELRPSPRSRARASSWAMVMSCPWVPSALPSASLMSRMRSSRRSFAASSSALLPSSWDLRPAASASRASARSSASRTAPTSAAAAARAVSSAACSSLARCSACSASPTAACRERPASATRLRSSFSSADMALMASLASPRALCSSSAARSLRLSCSAVVSLPSRAACSSRERRAASLLFSESSVFITPSFSSHRPWCLEALTTRSLVAFLNAFFWSSTAVRRAESSSRMPAKPISAVAWTACVTWRCLSAAKTVSLLFFLLLNEMLEKLREEDFFFSSSTVPLPPLSLSRSPLARSSSAASSPTRLAMLAPRERATESSLEVAASLAAVLSCSLRAWAS